MESDSNITKQDNQITKSKVVSETVESPKKGMWSWLSGKKTSSSTEAYLGESNKYVILIYTDIYYLFYYFLNECIYFYV